MRGDNDTERGEDLDTVVLGAGPAGLTAAHLLARRRRSAVVLEASETVGGIATTVEFEGFRFDLGGHRFFTKLRPIERLWEEMLGDDFLTRPRLSRIYHRGQFFAYPLRARDVVARLGFRESMMCMLSYAWAQARRRSGGDRSFEDWVTARFGRRLYDAFFRSYTEKVWGIPGTEIRAAWAAQRIKDFNLRLALLSMLGLRRRHVTTLIEEFRYPRLGPGQMWDAFGRHAEKGGVPVLTNRRCVGMTHAGGIVTQVLVEHQGRRTAHRVDGVISSIPLAELVLGLDPPAPAEVQAAARSLRYRDLVLVALTMDGAAPFPDNWIYLHDPATRAGRVQNFGAWSDGMVPDGAGCLGVEYFCFAGDDVWEMPEEEAVAMGRDELAGIGLIDPRQVTGGVKVRVPKAYPIYDTRYEEAVSVIRSYLSGFANLEPCGRNGLHHYNNQDHSMCTAILATLNLLDAAGHDVWTVNTDDVFLEEGELEDGPIGAALAPAEPVSAP